MAGQVLPAIINAGIAHGAGQKRGAASQGQGGTATLGKQHGLAFEFTAPAGVVGAGVH